jgi:hypothetical protein
MCQFWVLFEESAIPFLNELFGGQLKVAPSGAVKDGAIFDRFGSWRQLAQQKQGQEQEKASGSMY